MPRGGQVISHWHALIDNFNTSGLEFYTAVEEAVKAREVPEADFCRLDFKEGGFASAKREYLRVERRKIAFDICAAPYGTGFFFSWWMARIGPAHPWLWTLAFLAIFGVWGMIVVWLMSRWMLGSMVGQGGGPGCFLAIVLAGLPALAFLIGHAIHEGNVGIEEEDVLVIPVIGWIYAKVFNPFTYYSMDAALMFQESVRRAVNEVIEGLLTGQGLRALSEEQLKPTIRDLAR